MTLFAENFLGGPNFGYHIPAVKAVKYGVTFNTGVCFRRMRIDNTINGSMLVLEMALIAKPSLV
jgi:hypothetical protein